MAHFCSLFNVRIKADAKAPLAVSTFFVSIQDSPFEMWMEASSLKCISPSFESEFSKAIAAEPAWRGLQLNRKRWQLWMGQFTASFQCSHTHIILKKKDNIWSDLFLAEPSFTLNCLFIWPDYKNPNCNYLLCTAFFSSGINENALRRSISGICLLLFFCFFFLNVHISEGSFIVGLE